MQFPILSKIAKNKISLMLAVSLSGIASGLLIIQLFSKLKATYATFLLAAILSPLTAIIAGNSKRLLLALLVICLPITVDFTPNYTWNPGGAGGFIISLFDMILAGLYLLWLAELISEKRFNIKLYPSITVPAIFLIFFTCLSIIPAKRPEFSIYEIIEVIKMYLAFIYLANNVKTTNDVRLIMGIFIICLLFEGILGFAQHRYGEAFFPTTLGGPSFIDKRIPGTWHSYNNFSWYLTFILPVAFTLLFSEINIPFKLICWLSLFFGFGALIWTGSRAGWISYGASILFVVPFVFSKLKGKIKLINVFAVIAVLMLFFSPLFPRLYSKIDARFTKDDKGSADSRWPQFHIAFNIIRENPIIGVGINNYVQVIHDYDDTNEGIDSITKSPVHNIFLHITAEMGILAITVFVWLITVIFIKGIKFIISNESFSVYSVIGMIGGILAFLIHGLYDVTSIGGKLFMFFWVFSGIIVAISKMDLENIVQVKDINVSPFPNSGH